MAVAAAPASVPRAPLPVIRPIAVVADVGLIGESYAAYHLSDSVDTPVVVLDSDVTLDDGWTSHVGYNNYRFELAIARAKPNHHNGQDFAKDVFDELADDMLADWPIESRGA